ncbi:hypothetical protein NHJ13734_008644 [Beauveria thailandica]
MQLPVAFGVTLRTFLTCIAKGVMIAIGSGYMSVRTSRQTRLLDLEAKAPLYDHFLQTIDGGATIRAFQWQERFTKMNEELFGLSQKSFYALYSAQQWLQVVLDLLVAALATLLTALVLFATSKSTSGSVGVAPVNLLSFNTTLAQLITNWMQLENSLGAISRTKEFVTNPDHQPPKAAQDNRVDKSCWQRRPNFEASLPSYGDRVGICGRTGSDQSTLLSCLFSLVNITCGTISIDGQDITAISKDKLRAPIVTAPQQLLLIAGTARENLLLSCHPLCTDEAIVSVLEQLQILDRIHEHGGLDASIGSVPLMESQRRPLCIGRALLQPGGIVILDEPTSGFDEDPGRVVQELIREIFKGRLVVSVAHNIDTIIDSDLLVVMDHGQVEEMGPPLDLLTKRGKF